MKYLFLLFVLMGAYSGYCQHQHQISLSNSIMFSTDRYRSSKNLNLLLSYEHIGSKGFTWGVNVGFSPLAYRAYNKNVNEIVQKHQELITNKRLYAVDVKPQHNIFNFIHQNMLIGFSLGYRYREEYRVYRSPFSWWELIQDPNTFHNDIGIGIPIQYQYFFSKYWAVEANAAVRMYYKIPYSDKYLETHPQYTRYTAPHTLSVGLGLCYRFK